MVVNYGPNLVEVDGAEIGTGNFLVLVWSHPNSLIIESSCFYIDIPTRWTKSEVPRNKSFQS